LKTIAIIGAGAMGSGIAQVAAMAGCEVLLYDTQIGAVEKAITNIRASVNKLLEKGKIEAHQAVAIEGAIYPCSSIQAMADVDLVIEAIIEDLDIKKRVFSDLESVIKPDGILATNTSSLSITSIAASLKNPERCIGIHFFNPPVLMQLVEVIPAVQTSEDVVLTSIKCIEAWGKRVVKAKDTPGFIVNKVARPFYSEALRIYDEGLASKEEIDESMKLVGFKMGPFELMDFIGHDVNYRVTESVWRGFYFDPRYKPSLTQQRLFEASHFGRKSGKGFYSYPREEKEVTIEKDHAKMISNRILAMLINEAADTVYMGIASRNDVDTAVVYGLNYPRGLFAWAEEIGYLSIVLTLEEYYNYYQEDRYRLSPLLRSLSKN
jgi:3-hydroxybutyryl-CoA dehydrogenase